MLRKKNIKIFTSLMIMFYGYISAMYAGEFENIQIPLSKSMREELNECEKKINSDIQVLDKITTILSDKDVNNNLEIQYKTFCDVKDKRCKEVERRLNSEEDLKWVRDTIFKANERCYDTATKCLQESITIISEACKKNRKEVRTINSSVATVINNTSLLCEEVERNNKKALRVITKAADTCNYVWFGGLVRRVCKFLQCPDPLKIAHNKIEVLSNEITDIEGYKKSCSDNELRLYEKSDEVLKNINLEETRLLQKVLINYCDIEDDQYRDLIAKVKNKQTKDNNNAPVVYEESKQTKDNNNAPVVYAESMQTKSNNNAPVIQNVNRPQTISQCSLLSVGCVFGISCFIANKISQLLGFENAKFVKCVLILWLLCIGMGCY